MDATTVVPSGQAATPPEAGQRVDRWEQHPFLALGESEGGVGGDGREQANAKTPPRRGTFPSATAAETTTGTATTATTTKVSTSNAVTGPRGGRRSNRTVSEEQKRSGAAETKNLLTIAAMADTAMAQQSTDRRSKRSTDQSKITTATTGTSDINRRGGWTLRSTVVAAAPGRATNGGGVATSRPGDAGTATGGRGQIPRLRGTVTAAKAGSAASTAGGKEVLSLASRRAGPSIGVAVGTEARAGDGVPVGGMAPPGSLERLKRRRRPTRTARSYNRR